MGSKLYRLVFRLSISVAACAGVTLATGSAGCAAPLDDGASETGRSTEALWPGFMCWLAGCTDGGGSSSSGTTEDASTSEATPAADAGTPTSDGAATTDPVEVCPHGGLDGGCPACKCVESLRRLGPIKGTQ